MYYYNGYKVYITEGTDMQKRKHKKKRINKKWLKRYGTIKKDATNGQIMRVDFNSSLYMNRENFEKLKMSGGLKCLQK